MADEKITVPKTIEEAFAYLESLPGVEDFVEHGPGPYHFSLGMWIRNNWGLWAEEGELYNYFKDLGLFHADDMSGVILKSLHRKLTGKPLDIEGQVKYYLDYWRKHNEPKDD